MKASDPNDPNAKVLDDVIAKVREHGLTPLALPSPGRVVDSKGMVLPASYANFYIANAAVLVPQYGSEQDEAALHQMQAMFKDRKVIGVPCQAILTGGGAVHCITQPQPALP